MDQSYRGQQRRSKDRVCLDRLLLKLAKPIISHCKPVRHVSIDCRDRRDKQPITRGSSKCRILNPKISQLLLKACMPTHKFENATPNDADFRFFALQQAHVVKSCHKDQRCHPLLQKLLQFRLLRQAISVLLERLLRLHHVFGQ